MPANTVVFMLMLFLAFQDIYSGCCKLLARSTWLHFYWVSTRPVF
jgi:hypothetical protein